VTMIERQFTEDRLAALYDLFYPPERRADFAFYLPLIMSARAVLDVACGTGALLRLAGEAGHTGRLCGLDPAGGMLNQARRRSDIEWVHGDLASVGWAGAFDLIVMTGHAFQEFVEDEEIRAALAAIRAALGEGGRFAFETRNPLDRAWERWPTAYSGAVTDATGATVRCVYRIESPYGGRCRALRQHLHQPRMGCAGSEPGDAPIPRWGYARHFPDGGGPGDRCAVWGLDQGSARRDQPRDHHHRAHEVARQRDVWEAGRRRPHEGQCAPVAGIGAIPSARSCRR